MAAIPLDELRASFLRHLRAEGKSENTIKVYGTAVDRYIAWLATEGLDATAEQATRSLITTWLAGLADGHEPATIAVRHRGLRAFTKWATAEGELDTDPMAGLREPKVVAKPVPVLDDAQLAALLKLCVGRDFRSRRMEAMLRLFIDCGLRVGEAAGLTLDHVDLDREVIIVHGKGRKIRAVYPSSRTVRSLDRYLRVRRTHPHAASAYVFIGARGGPLATASIRQWLGALGKQAGIKHLHPHMLRHTWASDWLESGGTEGDLKSLAGWSSSAMLARYGAARADARAREAARRLRRGDRV